MDLRTYLRVIWRFRLIVGAGLIVAVLLAGLSYLKVSFNHGRPAIAYRQSETWTSSVKLAVTQAGAPVGTPSADTTTPVNFALVAANLADSDSVQAMATRRTHIHGLVQATSDTDPVTRDALPFITVNAFALTRTRAVALANGAARALQIYVSRQQAAGGLPKAQRVALRAVKRARAVNASVSAGRKKTTPIVIFLTVMIAALGFAFILENLRPRVHLVASDADRVPAQPNRRSA